MHAFHDLAALQRDFGGWLVRPTGAVERRLGPPARLAVYQNNYRSQLVNCLQVSYPQVRAWLGEEAFLAAAVHHIGRRPPHAWTLDAYADGLPDTLQERYPDNPDLHELAWIEHALQAAFVAADAGCPAPDWHCVDWESATLRLAPSLRWRIATTNAERIWHALDSGEPVPGAAMLAEPGGLLVWRRGYRCMLRQADAVDYAALLELRRNGGSFAALCAWLAARLGEGPGVAHAGQLLGQWLAGELITGTVDDAADVPARLAFITE